MNRPEDDLADRRLDAQLRAAFAPPPAATYAAAAAQATASPPKAGWRWQWVLAAAALLLTVGVAFLQRRCEPASRDGAELGSLWAAAYEHALANSAGSDGKRFCCDPSLDFCGTCEQRFAVRIGIGPGIEDLTLRGCYCGLPTGGCVAALIDTAQGPVGVFVLPRAKDPGPRLPAGSALRLARRELGSLVLYAVGGERQTPQRPLERFVLQS